MRDERKEINNAAKPGMLSPLFVQGYVEDRGGNFVLKKEEEEK